MMNKKVFANLVFVFIVLVFILFSASFVDAAILGVNRASVTFDNVLRGGFAEEEIIVSIGRPDDVFVFFEARGEIADWISFEPSEGSFFVSEGDPGVISVMVEPPSDARVDSYEGTVFISTGALGNVSSAMGSNVVVAFEVDVLINITDTQIVSCTAGGLDISDVEIDEENVISARVRNTGNVRYSPAFDVKVFSQMQDEVVKEYTYSHNEDIIPTRTSLIEGSFNLDLDPGQYWAEVSEPVCGSRSMITFSVLERGGISDTGVLEKVSAKTWASVGEIVPIIATFKNEGSRTVSAQFKGTVTKDDRVIEIVESDVINVPPDSEVELDSFFSPDDSGQYRVSGRVHFNNRVSYERGTIINVNFDEEGSVAGSVDFIVWFFSVLVVIFFLLVFLILRKEKKKKRKKF